MVMSPSRRAFACFCFALLALLASSRARAQQANNCLVCHSALDPPLQVTSEQFSHDIHAQKGLTCASCHGGDPDRKSTRLNSSHVEISYAVFCLKKKTAA